jgi:hypothetical protein
MSVIGPSCNLPSKDSPGSGCAPPEQGRRQGRRNSIGDSAGMVACTACCVLPFTLPATLLALAGGSIAVLDHAHGWVTRIAVVTVITGWIWIARQIQKTGRPMARRTAVSLIAATLLTATAAWPLLEPAVFKTLGIVKKKALPQGG